MENKIEELKIYLYDIVEEYNAYTDNYRYYLPDCPDKYRRGTIDDFERGCQIVSLRADMASEILKFLEKENI